MRRGQSRGGCRGGGSGGFRKAYSKARKPEVQSRVLPPERRDDVDKSLPGLIFSQAAEDDYAPLFSSTTFENFNNLTISGDQTFLDQLAKQSWERELAFGKSTCDNVAPCSDNPCNGPRAANLAIQEPSLTGGLTGQISAESRTYDDLNPSNVSCSRPDEIVGKARNNSSTDGVLKPNSESTHPKNIAKLFSEHTAENCSLRDVDYFTPLKPVDVDKIPDTTDERKAAKSARFSWESDGNIHVAPRRTGPNKCINVSWEIPSELIQEDNDSSGRFKSSSKLFKGHWIGLFRARTRVDAADAFLVQRVVRKDSFINKKGNIEGSMTLRTPRGVGHYDLRYFSQSLEIVGEHDDRDGASVKDRFEKAVLFPICKSNVVVVEVQGSNVIEAIDFVQKNLRDREKTLRATIQFCSLLGQLRTLKTPLLGRPSDRKPRSGRRDVKVMSEVEQEQSLIHKILKTVGLNIRLVNEICAELSHEIEACEVELARRNEEFVSIDSLKVSVRKESLAAKSEIDREESYVVIDTGSLIETDEIENAAENPLTLPGQLCAEDFALWKNAKEALNSSRQTQNRLCSTRANLSSALQLLLMTLIQKKDLFVNSGNPLGHDQDGSRSVFLSKATRILRLYCPIYEIFFSSAEKLKKHYETNLGLRFCESIDEISRFMVPMLRKHDLVIQDKMIAIVNEQVSHQSEGTIRTIVSKLDSIVKKGVLGGAQPWKCNMKLVPFGSSLSRLGSCSSDLDLTLVLLDPKIGWPLGLLKGPSVRKACKVSCTSKVIDCLAEILRDNGLTNIDDSRKNARIPVLRFHYPEYQVDCDISINNRVSVRNSLLLRTYANCDPRVRVLVFVLKYWSKRRGINDPSRHTLSSYGYVLLVVFFCQQLRPYPLLPPLQTLSPKWDAQSHAQSLNSSSWRDENRDDNSRLPVVLCSSDDGKEHNTYFYGDPCSEHFVDGGNNCWSKLESFAAQNTDSIAELLVRLFWFLSFGFDWRRDVISIREGKRIGKEVKANEDSWKLHRRIAIEDPFETSYDVAHVVRDKEFKVIQKEFVRGYAILTGGSVEKTPPGLNIVEHLCQAIDTQETDQETE